MIGAIILAAGQNSRMEEFQPMLSVSGTSAIKKQINTLRQAGVGRFVVVTGYQAEQLEKHLAHRGVSFVRNPEYASSQMLDSIKYALQTVENWERALIMPADLPSFREETIRRILETEGEAVIPRYEGKDGHPIALDGYMFPEILRYQGEDGLRGIFRQAHVTPVYIDVDDPAVLLRANTQSQYQELLDYEKQQLKDIPLHVEVQASVIRREPFFDETLAEFLSLMEERGSMLAAGKELKMAYSRVWKMVGLAEEQLGFSLVERQAGGNHGGSTRLTEQGKDFLSSYQSFRRELAAAAEQLYEKHFSDDKS